MIHDTQIASNCYPPNELVHVLPPPTWRDLCYMYLECFVFEHHQVGHAHGTPARVLPKGAPCPEGQADCTEGVAGVHTYDINIIRMIHDGK